MTLDQAGKKALLTRLMIGPALIAIVVGVYALDQRFTDGGASAAVVGVLAMLGLYEYVTMMRGAGFPIARRISLTAALTLHAMPAFISTWGVVDTELYPPVLLTVALVFVLSVRALGRTKMEQGLEEIGSTLLGFVLVSWPLYLAQGLALRSTSALFYAILVAKSGDIGGYFAGISFGSKKLIPHVSPGKSVEGAVGSLVVSCLVAALLAAPLLPTGTLSLVGAVLVGVMINVTTQLGDLVESLLKRRCGVKDSSNLLPVHGGVLDLVDSLLFSIPAFFFVFVRLT